MENNLKMKVRQLGFEIERLELQNKEAHSKIKLLNMRNRELEMENDELAVKVRRLEGEKKEAHSKIDLLNMRNRELEMKNNELELKNKELEMKNQPTLCLIPNPYNYDMYHVEVDGLSVKFIILINYFFFSFFVKV
jgi:predicted RNase H-like nuclease (RuvC/YqgF family)